ncbi:hypothetical protein [Domibacillus tundrae]
MRIFLFKRDDSLFRFGKRQREWSGTFIGYKKAACPFAHAVSI